MFVVQHFRLQVFRTSSRQRVERKEGGKEGGRGKERRGGDTETDGFPLGSERNILKQPGKNDQDITFTSFTLYMYASVFYLHMYYVGTISG